MPQTLPVPCPPENLSWSTFPSCFGGGSDVFVAHLCRPYRRLRLPESFSRADASGFSWVADRAVGKDAKETPCRQPCSQESERKLLPLFSGASHRSDKIPWNPAGGALASAYCCAALPQHGNSQYRFAGPMPFSDSRALASIPENRGLR